MDNQYPAIQEVLCIVLYNVLKFDQVLEIRSLITLNNVIGQHRSANIGHRIDMILFILHLNKNVVGFKF